MTLATVKLFSNNTLVQKLASIDIRYAVPTFSSDGEIITMQSFELSLFSEAYPTNVFECTLLYPRSCDGCNGSIDVSTKAYWVGPSISYMLNTAPPFQGALVGAKPTNITYII